MYQQLTDCDLDFHYTVLQSRAYCKSNHYKISTLKQKDGILHLADTVPKQFFKI